MAINTFNERGLHAGLKVAVAAEGAVFEVARHGYIIDVVQPDGELVEVQTSGLGKLRRKLGRLSAAGERVRLVLPVAVRTVLHGPGAGAVRVSPKKGALVDVFGALVHAPQVVGLSGLRLTVALVEEDVERAMASAPPRRRRWRQRPVVVGRALRRVVAWVEFADGAAVGERFLPEGLAEPFTTADLAGALGVQRRQAQQVAYVLRALGLIVAVDESRKRNIGYVRVGGEAG